MSSTPKTTTTPKKSRSMPRSWKPLPKLPSLQLPSPFIADFSSLPSLRMKKKNLQKGACSIDKNKSNKKSVTFAKMAKMYHTLALTSYTDAEIDQCWYTPREYDEIAVQYHKEIIKLNQGQVFKDKKYCSRGLERLNTQDLQGNLRNRIQSMSIQAVLERQQEVKAVYNTFVIAQAYNYIAKRSQRMAYQRGFRDQKWVFMNNSVSSRSSSSSETNTRTQEDPTGKYNNDLAHYYKLKKSSVSSGTGDQSKPLPRKNREAAVAA